MQHAPSASIGTLAAGDTWILLRKAQVRKFVTDCVYVSTFGDNEKFKLFEFRRDANRLFAGQPPPTAKINVAPPIISDSSRLLSP